jgi:hypothetical protein
VNFARDCSCARPPWLSSSAWGFRNGGAPAGRAGAGLGCVGPGDPSTVVGANPPMLVFDPEVTP